MRFKDLAVRLSHSLLVVALCGLHLVYAQEGRSVAMQFSHPDLDAINSLVKARRYKEAIDHSLSGAQKMRDRENWEGYISLMLRAAEIETFEVWKAKGFPEITITEDYRRPLRYLSDMYTTAGQHIGSYPYLQANALFTNAVVYDLLNMPDTAEQMHLAALKERIKIYGPESREVADCYLWLGQLYNWGLQRKELAEKYYLMAVPLQKTFLPESRYALGSAYYGLATIARKNFQFDVVETMADLYLSLYVDLPYEQAFAYQLVANMYSNQGNYEQSMRMRERSLEIYEASGFREDLIDGYSNLSSDLRTLGRYKESRNALENGLRIWQSSEPRNPYYAKTLYENLGDHYRMMKKYDSALYFSDKAIQSAIHMFGEKSEELAGVYDLRGRLFMDRGEYPKAVEDFDRMLTAVLPSADGGDNLESTVIQDESPYFFSIIAAHFNKGDALVAWYQQDKNSLHLEQALDNYRIAHSQVIVARQSIGDDLSKPFLMSNFSGSIERSIQCAGLLYNQTGEVRFFNDILRFAELTKYLNVLEALERAERANNSGIPKSLLFELEEVRNELNIKQRSRLSAENLSPDSAGRINEEVVALINRRRELMTRISGYPEYTESGINRLLISLDEIQSQLGEDEQLMEFYWGGDSVYVLSITGSASCISAIPRNADTDMLIASVYQIISGDPSYGQQWANRYAVESFKIYDLFFKPSVSRKRLIIVPDGPLSLIPVEALVTSSETGQYNSFKELNYLIYDHEVSYAYSSSIYFKGKTRERDKIEKVLAFSYSGEGEGNYVARRNQYAELPGTYLELETLSRLYDRVTRFTNGGASKVNFVRSTAGYDLIHLGVHGVGDQEVADNSHLIFKGDSTMDSVLYAYEIYNLKLDAGLIVLGACETGIGRNQAGEGVLSIARAFTYAGCPSVVMSLWQVPDIFTSMLMTRFYENLKDGQSVSTSLRNSKLRFLEESDMFSAHPANWAAFVVNGQDIVFKKNSGGTYRLVASIAAAIILMGGAYTWYRRTRTGKAT